MNSSEETCEQCGGKNVCWFSPSDIWNAVARRADGTDPMLCPNCFIQMAETAGYDKDAWKVVPEFGDSCLREISKDENVVIFAGKESPVEGCETRSYVKFSGPTRLIGRLFEIVDGEPLPWQEP